MKRSWNPILWTGFALALAIPPIYFALFISYQNARESPWATLVLIGLSALMLGIGIRRAYKFPQQFRGKILGPIMALLSVASVGLLLMGVRAASKGLPASMNSPRPQNCDSSGPLRKANS